ncbi:MAG: dioxygenase family protein [Burkholderiales bacterium]
MDRKHFLRTIGGVALVPFVPQSFTAPRDVAAATAPAGACQFSPSVPEGPFYFDTKLVRQEIAEGRPGIPIEYRLTVVNASCQPVTNAAIDIWQCDSDGVYSGYAGQATGANTTGTTFLRGIQPTNAQGLTRFTAIYPGWYPRRLTHLHVKIHLSSKTIVTTNLFYPDAVNAEVYSSPQYKARGPNPTTVAQDVELRGDTARFKTLMLNVTQDGSGRYVGTYTFGIST